MSIPVPLERLRGAIAERAQSAYLLTVSDDGRAHAVHVPVHWEDDVLAARVGKRSAANAAARPGVSLLYPLRSPDDYSLIVDGTGIVAGSDGEQRVLVTPTRAVLHRPAAVPRPDASCSADCVPLLPATKPVDR
jgi:hypothetical protein